MTAAAKSSPPARVGYILKMFPRLSETFILNEVLELERQGLPLRIFSLKQPVDAVFHAQASDVRSPVMYVPERFRQCPMRIARAQLYVWRRYRRPWQHTLRNAIRRARSGGDTSNLVAFRQACCVVEELPGIRHLHAHYANVPAKVALLVQRLTGISYSITTHAKDIFQNNPLASPKLQERLTRASFVAANSRFSAQHIRASLSGRGHVHVVYNGLNLEAFPFRPNEPQQPVILGVGRLVAKKGFGVLVAACGLLKNKGLRFTCEIVGTGVLSSQMKEQIRAHDVGDRVKLLGPLPQQVLLDHYVRAAVFVLPCVRASDGDRDILPNALKEAMAVGVPVVTTRLDGIEELVDHGVSGLLVEPGDAPGLAAQIELLLKNAELRRGLARQGRSVIEQRFDRRATFTQLKTLLQDTAAIAQPQDPVPEPALANV